MTTFVLVHGAWHGGWCWDRVAAPLRAAGHEVHAPTLTGLSERAHLLSPLVGLDTHVEDVVRLIDVLGLTDVVLVGHSYAGQIVTAVADRRPGRSPSASTSTPSWVPTARRHGICCPRRSSTTGRSRRPSRGSAGWYRCGSCPSSA